jgi:hypothetical protein
MSPADVEARATYELAFKKGQIPTTFAGGVRQSVGDTLAQHSGAIGALASMAAPVAARAVSALFPPAAPIAAAATAPLTALGPLIGRGVQTAGEYLAGRPITTPTVNELATLGGVGAAGAYGPAILAHGGSALANTIGALKGDTLPQAVTKGLADAAAPTVTKIAASMTPAAVAEAVATDARTLGNMAGNMATRARYGLSADDVDLFLRQVKTGMRPTTAAKIISNNDPTKISGLLTMLQRARTAP